jgi:hypothetical protein
MRPLCLLLILLASCEKEEGSRFVTNYGNFEAELNGERWKHKLYEGLHYIHGYRYRPWPCNESSGMTLALITYSADTKWRTSRHDLLTFWQVPLARGTYQLHPMSLTECLPDSVVQTKFRIMTNEGFVASYSLIQSANNYLTVESYDAGTETISGSFEAHMVNESGTGNQWYADTLHFTRGRFRTKFLF